MRRWLLWLVLIIVVLAFASANQGPPTAPAGPPPAATEPAAATVAPLPECPAGDDQCELARVTEALTTKAPGEDELIARINTKYGGPGREPGESGASWCHRQRLRTLMAGGGDPDTVREMACQADGVNYPDTVLSPDAATDWH